MLSQNLLKSQIPFMGEGGGIGELGPNFQLLMMSPNLLKSQIPFTGVGAGPGTPTFNF